MTRALTAFAALAAAAACASCAPVEQPSEAIAGLSTERQCFFTQRINGYSEAPDGPRGDRLYIDTGPNDRWLFETFGSCLELDWTLRIALDTRGPSSLCTGDTATVILPSTFNDRPPARCTVRLLGKMAEAR